MKKILQRWVREEERSLKRLSYGKTATARFGGLRRNEANHAKLFFVAFAPMLLAVPFTPWSTASTLGKIVMVVTGAWAALVFLAGIGMMLWAVANPTKAQND